jgi:photosystem II stability/assembly factor-like uncharacterized protein
MREDIAMHQTAAFQQIRALAALAKDPAPRLFAGTDAGLFVSCDGGERWENALAGSGLSASGAVTVLHVHHAPGGAQVLLAGALGGVFCSTDGGDSWQAVSFGLPAPVVTALCSSPDGMLHAGTVEDGVYTSKDGGRSWARWNFGLLDWRVFSIAAAALPGSEKPILFAGAESGMYASRNGGRAWQETTFPDGLGALLALSAAPGGYAIFAGSEAGTIYCSTDSGASWPAVFSDPQGEEISALLSGPGWTCAACGSRVIATRDQGQTWLEWHAPGGADEAPTAVTALCAAPDDPALLFAARDDGAVLTIQIS